MNQINFPVEAVKELPMDKPQNISCKVTDVYPKPIVSFLDHDGVLIRDEKSIREENSPLKSNVYEVTSSTKSYSYTPKYTDNNKNVSCSVFSFGSNATISKSITLNVAG